MVPLLIHHSINYSTELAPVFAQLIFDINYSVCRHGASFAQQFIFQKGRKKFGKHGNQAAINEFDQLHHRNCFAPIDLSKLTPLEKKKAQAAVMLLSEKKDGTVNGRCVYEGSKTRPYFTKEETASPTASTEGIFILRPSMPTRNAMLSQQTFPMLLFKRVSKISRMETRK